MVLVRSAMVMRSFSPNEILARRGVNESELRERYNVEEVDWLALSAIFLSEIFSSSILTPLRDEETRIQLEVTIIFIPGFTVRDSNQYIYFSAPFLRQMTSILVVTVHCLPNLISITNLLNGFCVLFNQKLFPCPISPSLARSIVTRLTVARLGRKKELTFTALRDGMSWI